MRPSLFCVKLPAAHKRGHFYLFLPKHDQHQSIHKGVKICEPLKEKTGPDRTAIWKIDRTGPGRKYQKTHGVAVPLRLRAGNGGHHRAPAQRVAHFLRLRQRPLRQAPSEIGRASLTYVDGTCVEMIRAGTVRCNNTSGVPGVNWVARKQRWQASICFKGTRHYLGSYKELSEAVQARKRAEEELYLPFLEQFEKSKEE